MWDRQVGGRRNANLRGPAGPREPRRALARLECAVRRGDGQQPKPALPRAPATPRPQLPAVRPAAGRGDEISRASGAARAGAQHGGFVAAVQEGLLSSHVGSSPQDAAPAHPEPPAPPPAPAPAPAPALGRPEAPAAAAAAGPGGRRRLAGGHLPGVAHGGGPEAQDRSPQPGPQSGSQPGLGRGTCPECPRAPPNPPTAARRPRPCVAAAAAGSGESRQERGGSQSWRSQAGRRPRPLCGFSGLDSPWRRC